MSMTVLAVDDEPIALEVLGRAIREVVPNCSLFAFTDPLEALEQVKCGSFYPDVAFLDVEMFDLTGLELAKRLKDLYNCVNIVFVTGYAEYMGEAFHLHASGYVLKPATPETIRWELEDLRRPVLREDDGRLREEEPGSRVLAFTDPLLAVKYGYNNPVDKVYAKTDMRGLRGNDVARLLEKVHPNLQIELLDDEDGR